MQYLIGNTNDFSVEFFDEFFETLDLEEKQRILKKQVPENRVASLLALYLLKKGLKDFYNIKEYKLLRTKKGKPYLQNEEVNFSISHTKNMVAVAFSNNDIGIDIEYERECSDVIVDRMFNQAEKQYAMSQKTNFTRMWTLKEAAVKAIGESIAFARNINFLVEKDNISCSIDNSKITHIVKDGLIISICEINS